MFGAIGMEFVRTRGRVGQDVRWIVKTRSFASLGVGGGVKTRAFGGSGRTGGGTLNTRSPKRRVQIFI